MTGVWGSSGEVDRDGKTAFAISDLLRLLDIAEAEPLHETEVVGCRVAQEGRGVSRQQRLGGYGRRGKPDGPGELPASKLFAVNPEQLHWLQAPQQRRVDQIPLADPLTVTAEDQPHPGDDLAVPQTLLL